MKNSRLSNFRSETVLEITQQGKATVNELALKIAFMTDEEVHRFFEAYYPEEFKTTTEKLTFLYLMETAKAIADRQQCQNIN